MIIGLHGKAGAGKDTFADRLVERFGYMKRGFATPLYEEVAHAFRVTVPWLADRSRKEQPQPELRLTKCIDGEFVDCMKAGGLSVAAELSPRQVLQQWGTEYRRAQDVEYWLKQMALYAKAAYEMGAKGIAIVDTRFENEAQWVRDCRGVVVEILRPGLPAVEGRHSSAAGLPGPLINHVLYNSAETVEDFHIRVDDFMKMMLGGRIKRTALEPVPA